jgi:hypothetical protein
LKKESRGRVKVATKTSPKLARNSSDSWLLSNKPMPKAKKKTGDAKATSPKFPLMVRRKN